MKVWAIKNERCPSQNSKGLLFKRLLLKKKCTSNLLLPCQIFWRQDHRCCLCSYLLSSSFFTQFSFSVKVEKYIGYSKDII